MAKKILFVFSGTGDNAQRTRDFIEAEASEEDSFFADDVIRVYFNGCQDTRVGGKSMLSGYLDPDIDVVAGQIRRVFSKNDKAVQFNLDDLRRAFGNSIIIESNEALNDVEEIEDITLNGFSRGGVTTFSMARALDDLDIPMSILAEDPVPGEDRSATNKNESIYKKNFDLSACKNIVRGEILLGTYSKKNSFWENKWFRQMAAIFPTSSDNHIFVVPKRTHIEFNRRANNYKFEFLFNRGLTEYRRTWDEDDDIPYLIPDVEQQKFHFGVVGRVQYLPSYKASILAKLHSKYNEIGSPCPITQDSKFKIGQALSALHNASMNKKTHDDLARAVLADTDKAKGLREFIIQIDSIIQYSKGQDVLQKNHLVKFAALEQNLYERIADFYTLDKTTIKQREEFSKGIHDLIKAEKVGLPKKVSNKLSELSGLLLKENTLVHTHLIKLIDDDETFRANRLTADQSSYDAELTNALELAKKLFHSSANQRSVVFNETKPFLKDLIHDATDLADIIPFLKPGELKETLRLVGDKIKTFDDVLLLMNVLPSYEHHKILYHATKNKFKEMSPTPEKIEQLMEYLSDKKCRKIFESFKEQLGSIKKEGEDLQREDDVRISISGMD